MPPGELVMALAKRKISNVAKENPNDLVLGGDTIVYIDAQVLGKPGSKEEAAEMLRRIAGRTHQVYTGIALYHPVSRAVFQDVDVTSVTMKDMDDREIRWYVETGEPMDKAGSYALQGVGGFFVTKVCGDFSGVVGLPLPKVYGLLRRAGVSLEQIGML